MRGEIYPHIPALGVLDAWTPSRKSAMEIAMTLVSLLIALLVIALVLYVVQILPLDSTPKMILQVAVVILLLVWLLRSGGFAV